MVGCLALMQGKSLLLLPEALEGSNSSFGKAAGIRFLRVRKPFAPNPYLFHSIFLEKYITEASIKNNPMLPTKSA
jgi:hypothetical protein